VEARWAGKQSLLSHPQQSTLPSSGSMKMNGDRDRVDEGGDEATTTATAVQKSEGEATPEIQLTTVEALEARLRQLEEVNAINAGAGVPRPGVASGPGEAWQPETWVPNSKSR